MRIYLQTLVQRLRKDSSVCSRSQIGCSRRVETLRDPLHDSLPVQRFSEGTRPMPASTQAAHVVKPYTKASGKYVMVRQQKRSTFLAQLRRRMAGEGDPGGEGEPSVAIRDWDSSGGCLGRTKCD